MCNHTAHLQRGGQNALQYCCCWDESCLLLFFFFFRLLLNPPLCLLLTSSRVRLSNYHLLRQPSLPPSALSLYSSISSIRSSPSREESAVTWTALTVPAIGELTTVSIFMAERTHSGWPFSTFHDYKDSSQSIKNMSQIYRPLNKLCSW